MVMIRIFFILSFCLSSAQAFSEEKVKVTSQADEYQTFANHPVKGTVLITHDENLKVDLTSFLMEEKPLQVDFINDTKISPNSPIVVSIYRFELGAQPQGLHVLPEVSVKVGGVEYRSAPSTYEVSAAAIETQSIQQTPASGNQPLSLENTSTAPSLKLEALYEGPSPMYPGQRGKLIYRYYFSGNIELRKENLPLFEAKGLLKIGEQAVKDYQQGSQNIEEISQIVQAVSQGEFKYGPSSVDGFSYQEDDLGGRTYSKTPLKADAPVVTVTVKPFPIENVPSSFNGAVGQFTFNVSMKSPVQVALGDRIVLSIEISSNDPGALENMLLPDLCCQPGFSGLFRMSDLPPTSIIKGDTKYFIVDMRPLTTTIKEVPSIELSYFNPQTQKYTILHSHPIPLSVVDLKNESLKEKSGKEERQLQTWPEVSTKPEGIEIEGNFILSSADLHNLLFGTWWVTLLIPIGIGLIWLQINFQNHLIKQKELIPTKNSEDLFVEALAQQQPSLSYSFFSQALLLRLYENGLIPSAHLMPEDLSQNGIVGEVREFLFKIEELRFGGKSDLTQKQTSQEASALFKKIATVRKIS